MKAQRAAIARHYAHRERTLSRRRSLLWSGGGASGYGERADADPAARPSLGRNGHPQMVRVRTLIRVLVAADQALLRASYRALLESDERIAVVGEAGQGRQALALAAQTLPDVALVDLGLPGLDGADALPGIISDLARARVAVLVIGPRQNDERFVSALRAGAVGILSRDAEPAQLIGAVQLVAAGQALLPAVSLRRLLAAHPAHFRHDGRLHDQLAELTDRELEVVALVATGLNNGEIAQRLVISPATAKTHVSRAMTKARARDRAQLIVLAYETGLVPAHANGGS
jgi:DNA-binding NarL/FixJ family response regulator